MTKERKYAAIVVTISIVAILVIYYLAMRNPSQPMTDQPILSSQNKGGKVEKSNNSDDKVPSQSLAGITDNKPEYPVTPSQTSSISQMQPSSLPKETKQERLLYTKAVGLLKPEKTWQVGNYIRYELRSTGIRQELIDEELKLKPGTIRRRGMATIYQENCEKVIKGLEELIQQYPDSAHLQHHQEILTFLKQMLQEDEELPYRYYRGGMLYGVRSKKDSSDEVSPEEQVKAYIHYLRQEGFLDKVQGSFKMCFNQPQINTNKIDEIVILGAPNQNIISFGRKIVLMGNTAIPELVKLFDDRRPITVDDEIDRIPTRFYRYQDAAVDILQTMFSHEGNKINPKIPLAQKPFPVEIPAGEYFSEYLEKQTPEMKQKIINEIKQWVDESMRNPPEQKPTK